MCWQESDSPVLPTARASCALPRRPATRLHFQQHRQHVPATGKPRNAGRDLPQPIQRAFSVSLLQYHPSGLLPPQPYLRNAGAEGLHPCGMPGAPSSRLAGRAQGGWLVGTGLGPPRAGSAPGVKASKCSTNTARL